jgi:hypothetical protein
MVSNRLWLVVLSVLALTLGACGDDGGGGESGAGAGGTSGMGGDGDGDGDGASNDVAPDGICARVAAIQCAAQEECCVDPQKQSLADCTEDALDNCEDLAAVAADSRVGYDRAAMKAALDDYQMRSAECDVTIAERAVAGFASAFKGTVAAGGDCLPEGGADTTDFTDLGAALASCTGNATTACLPSATDWKCTARGGAGSPCFTPINCQDGMWCDSAAAQAVGEGVCTAQKAADETCNAPEECESFVCKSGKCVASDDVQEIFCY